MKIRAHAESIGAARSVPWMLIIEAILAALENCDSERASRVDPDVGRIILRRRLRQELMEDGMSRREARIAARDAAEDIFALDPDDRRECICELRGESVS